MSVCRSYFYTSIDIEQYSSDFEVGTVCSHLKLGISPRHSLWRWKEGVHRSGIGQGVALPIPILAETNLKLFNPFNIPSYQILNNNISFGAHICLSIISSKPIKLFEYRQQLLLMCHVQGTPSSPIKIGDGGVSGSHDLRARRARMTKSRGLQLEVDARRAPRL